eukprot:g59534.t1
MPTSRGLGGKFGEEVQSDLFSRVGRRESPAACHLLLMASNMEFGPLEKKGLSDDLLSLRLLYSIGLLACILSAAFFATGVAGKIMCVGLIFVFITGIYGARIGTSRANAKRREMCLTFFCRGLYVWVVIACALYGLFVGYQKKFDKMVSNRCNYDSYPNFVLSFNDGSCSRKDCEPMCEATVRRYLIIDGAILLFIACLISFTVAQYSWATLARLERYHSFHLDGSDFNIDEPPVYSNPSLVSEDFVNQSKQGLRQEFSGRLPVRPPPGTGTAAAARLANMASTSYVMESDSTSRLDASTSRPDADETGEVTAAHAGSRGDAPAEPEEEEERESSEREEEEEEAAGSSATGISRRPNSAKPASSGPFYTCPDIWAATTTKLPFIMSDTQNRFTVLRTYHSYRTCPRQSRAIDSGSIYRN